MTAGAAQILLKQSGVLASRAVLAGSGPLLYLIAAQMVRAGTPPLALIETQTKADFINALPHIGGALRGWRYLKKGMGLLAALRRAGVKRYTAASNLSVDGTEQAEALRFSCGGKTHAIPCDTVLLHQGVVPNIQASRSLGLDHRWNPAQHCFAPVLNVWGQTSEAEFYVAGDGGGIGGAVAAEHCGRIAALHAAASLGHVSEGECETRAGPLRNALARELAARPFLDAAYPPPPSILRPADKTIICRCEEITAGDIRRYAKLGCIGPNQTKAFGRSGMGPCQGRYCGLTVTNLLTEATGMSPGEIGYYKIRPPLKPVTLAELAAMKDTGSEAAAE